VIEASGIADPARIAAIGSGGDAFWLEAIVTVADAETLRQRAADPLVGDTRADSL
jgi:G3E family GTPase